MNLSAKTQLIYTVPAEANVKLSEHFRVKEFQSYSSTYKRLFSNTVKIYSGLIDGLEKLITSLNATSCTIVNGYRCTEHNRKIGGATNSTHLYGYAADCKFYRGNNVISGRIVCCHAEALGFSGIGYMANNSVHLDVSPARVWYGDETKKEGNQYYSLTKHGQTFIKYFGLTNEEVFVLPKTEIDTEEEEVKIEDRTIGIFGKDYHAEGMLVDGSNYISPKVFAEAGLKVSSDGSKPVISMDDIKLSVGGKDMSVSGMNANGSIYVGVRAIAEALGKKVSWVDGKVVID